MAWKRSVPGKLCGIRSAGNRICMPADICTAGDHTCGTGTCGHAFRSVGGVLRQNRCITGTCHGSVWSVRGKLLLASAGYGSVDDIRDRLLQDVRHAKGNRMDSAGNDRNLLSVAHADGNRTWTLMSIFQ